MRVPLGRLSFLVIVAATLAATARAEPETFFGEDLNTTDDPVDPADDPQPLVVRPNADAARTAFLAMLSTRGRASTWGLSPRARARCGSSSASARRRARCSCGSRARGTC